MARGSRALMSDVTKGRASSASRRRPIAPRQQFSLEKRERLFDAADAREFTWKGANWGEILWENLIVNRGEEEVNLTF